MSNRKRRGGEDFVGSIFVDTEQTKNIFGRLDALVDEGWKENHCLSLLMVGVPGTGKSFTADQWIKLRTATAAAEGKSFKVLKVEMLPDSTLRSLASTVLDTLGDPAPGSGSQTELTRRIAEQVDAEEIDLIVLDEIQRLIDSRTEKVNRDAANWVTSLQNRRVCPLLLIGEPSAEGIFVGQDDGKNVYLQRRTDGTVRVLAYDWLQEADKVAFRVFLNMLEKELAFPERSGLADSEMAQRIHHACMGRIGLVARLIDKARSLALKRGSPLLTRTLLADANELLETTQTKGWVNAFLVQDLRSLHRGEHVRDEEPENESGPNWNVGRPRKKGAGA